MTDLTALEAQIGQRLPATKLCNYHVTLSDEEGMSQYVHAEYVAAMRDELLALIERLVGELEHANELCIRDLKHTEKRAEQAEEDLEDQKALDAKLITKLKADLAAARDEARKLQGQLDHAVKHYGLLWDQFDIPCDDNGEAAAAAMLARYQPATNHRHSPDPLVNHGYNDICSCGVRIHRDGDAWVPDHQPADEAGET